jgi:hypothetical protein
LCNVPAAPRRTIVDKSAAHPPKQQRMFCNQSASMAHENSRFYMGDWDYTVDNCFGIDWLIVSSTPLTIAGPQLHAARMDVKHFGCVS